MIGEGVQKMIIFTDSVAGLNPIQQNESGPGQTWDLAIIRSTEEIYSLDPALVALGSGTCMHRRQ
jgi:hypothetical protein